jgi:hypothetical protein
VGLIRFGGTRKNPVLKKQPQGTGAFHHIFEAISGPAAAPKTPEGIAYLVNQNPDQSEVIFRALNLKGELPRLIDPRFNGSIQMEDYTKPEYWWLRRGVLMQAGADQAAVAAQQSFVSWTPLQTTRLYVIERVRIYSVTANAGGVIGLGAAVAGGANQTNSNRDDRIAGTTADFTKGSGAVVVAGTSAAPVSPPGAIPFRLAPGAALDFGPYVITGRSVLSVLLSNVNIQLCVSFEWRERELLPSET